MNTQVKNFSIVKGAQSRIVVRFNDDVDIDSIEVYGGNDKCKCRQLIYHEIRRDEHSITLLSNPAPGNCPYLPYQVFIRETTTNVEWLVLTGQVSIISRYVGCEHEIEINPPIEDEILSVDVEIVYSKADLDDAVRRAMEAAACAENQAYCASVHSATARVWSENAQGFAWDAGSSANAASNAKTCACAAANAASTAKMGACNAANTAQSAVNTIDQLKTQTCQYKQQACQYKEQACQYKQTTCTYLDEVTGIAATKQDKLTWDSKPTSGSTNPVQSDGIYKCLESREKTLVAGTNISLTRLGNTTRIDASGGDVTSEGNNCFSGINTFNNSVYFNEDNCSCSQPAININEGGRISWGGAEISGVDYGSGEGVETSGTGFCDSTVCALQLKLGSYWTSRAGGKISAIAIKAASSECMENIAIEVSKDYNFQCSTQSLEASILPCEWTNWQLNSPIDNDGSPLFIRRFINCGDYTEIPWVGNYQCLESGDDSGYYNRCSDCTVCIYSLPKLRILGGTGGNINVNGSLKVNGSVNIGDNCTSYLLNVNGRQFTQPKPMVPVNGVPSDNVLLNGTTYITESCGADFSELCVEPYGTSELWIDNNSDTATSLPSWLWLDSEDKTASPITDWVSGYRYAIAVRNDGEKTLANVQYCYDRNN